MFENSRVCRTCSLTENELLPINAIIDNDTRVVDCFNECMKIDINEDDNLPQMICLTCLDHILEVRKFYLQIINAENYFKQILESNITKIQERNEIFDATFDPEIETIEEENISYSPNVVKEDCSEILVLSSQCDYENKDIDDDDDGYDEANTTKYEKIHQIDVERQELRFSCNNCNETFKYEKNFKLHLRINHGIVEDESKESQTIEQDITTAEYQNDNYESRNKSETVKKSKTKYRCPICSYIFTFKSNLSRHMKRRHPDVDFCTIKDNVEFDVTMEQDDDINYNKFIKRKSSEPKFRCEICDHSFTFKSNLLRHKQRRHKLHTDIGCKCPHLECTKILLNAKALKSHLIKTHSEGENSILCPICGKEFTKNIGLRRHLIRHENRERNFICKFCEKGLFTSEALKEHERIHTGERPYKCSYCEKSFIQSGAFNTHLLLHTGKTIQCQICDKKFPRKTCLRVHMRTHTQERPYICNICSKGFVQSSHLKCHMEGHSIERQYICNICDEGFRRKDSLRIHRYKHIQKKPFKCPSCSLETASCFWFRKHLQRSHNIFDDPLKYKRDVSKLLLQLPLDSEKINNNSNSKDETFNEIYLEDEIYNENNEVDEDDFKNNFNVHLQRHHEENDYENIDNDRNLLEINYEIYDNDDSNNVQLKFNEKIESTLTSTSSSRRNKCSQCDRKFSTKQAVKRHFQAMHVIICILCNVKLSSQKDLDVHIKNDHEEEYLIMNKNKTVKKKYPCPYCDKEFLTKENYISHERTHTGERPYKCEYCDKTFIQRSTLSTHMILHTGEKKIKCSICDKKFIREGFLKVHMRSHTNERPYSCKYCKQTYAQKCHLKSHINSIHLNDKPFKCDFCDMKFNRKDILQTHLFTHIGKPFKCPVCSMESALLYRFRKHLVKVHGIHDDPRNFKRDPTYDPNMIVEEISDIMNGEDIEILEIDDPNFMTEINC